MIKIKNISMRNFMSSGNALQSVNFDRNDLTLVLGENLDLGGDAANSRNGVGKTTLLNALSYALYGQALTNIKKDNLINKTNGKNMVVMLDFEVGGKEYRIERGRKPNFTKLFIDGNEKTDYTDTSQGDSRETQNDIERLLGMSIEMFRHIVALNTYTEPFLSMKINDQRIIIEQLLGITILSEKADLLKKQIKDTKDLIAEENIRIKAVTDANSRIEVQINNLKKRKQLWISKHEDECVRLERNIGELAHIDIDAEISSHRILEKVKIIQQIENRLAIIQKRQKTWIDKKNSDCAVLESEISKLEKIDINEEIENHRKLVTYNDSIKKKNESEKWLRNISIGLKKEESTQEKLKKEIDDLKNHKCYACGGELHDSNQETILLAKEKQLNESIVHWNDFNSQKNEHENILKTLGDLSVAPKVIYKNMEQALNHRATVDNMSKTLEERKNEINPFIDEISEIKNELANSQVDDIDKLTDVFYNSLEEALNHKNTLDTLINTLIQKQDEKDPYHEQIDEMEKTALQEISWDKINELNLLQDHQEFLLKMLTNKDSFVRKRIIDQNLAYLNSRLSEYLTAIGLPHQVIFQNDLSVEITELGRDLDFFNLSRGEMTRVILALSLSFRDVWENLYNHINLIFIDELIDNGIDSAGTEAMLKILKQISRERSKSIWLVSHKDELIGRVDNIQKVIKENGFTNFEID